MKRLGVLVLCLSSLCMSFAASAEPRINVRDITKPIGMGSYQSTARYIAVQSEQDGLIINQINVNRGQCNKIYYTGQNANPMPVKLAYGKTYYFQINNDCNIIDIEISTNAGTSSYR